MIGIFITLLMAGMGAFLLSHVFSINFHFKCRPRKYLKHYFIEILLFNILQKIKIMATLLELDTFYFKFLTVFIKFLMIFFRYTIFISDILFIFF